MNLLYKGEYSSCLDLCEPALDKIWEELNTGYWKDVPFYWRQAYSLVSLAKALSESALLSEPGRNIDHAVILRTCDMGLLMGAPILGNILAKMSREFQRAFGILSQWRRLSETAESNLDRETSATEDVIGTKRELPKICETKVNRSTNNIAAKIEPDIVDNQGREESHKGGRVKQESYDSNEQDKSSPAAKRRRQCDNEKIDLEQLTPGSGNITDSSVDIQKREDNKRVSGDVSDRLSSVSSHEISLPPTVQTQKTNEIPRCSCPSVEMFQAMFMDGGHPVIITDAIGYWPALTTRRWTLDYLRSVAGCRTVPVEIGTRYTEESWTQKLMTIGDMIDQYVTNPTADKAYLAQHQLFDQVS